MYLLKYYLYVIKLLKQGGLIMLCPNCNKEISDDSKFCQYCGKQIIEGTEYLSENTNTKKIFSSFISIIFLLLTIIFIKSGYKQFVSPKIKLMSKLPVNEAEIKKAVFVRMFYLSNTESLRTFCQDSGYVPNNFINLFSESFKNSIQNADNILESNGFDKNELNSSSSLNQKIHMEYENDYNNYKIKQNSSLAKDDYCRMYDDNASDMVKTKINIFKNAKPDLYFD